MISAFQCYASWSQQAINQKTAALYPGSHYRNLVAYGLSLDQDARGITMSEVHCVLQA